MSERFARVADSIRTLTGARQAVLTSAGIAAFAVATALAAQPEVRLPFTPVPLTLQVLGVLLAGYVLGPRAAFSSQALYLMAGAAGLPVFAGGASGPIHLLGPTGGYLWAFPAAAWTVGWLAEGRPRGSWVRLSAAFAGIAVVHLGGAAGLACFLVATGQPVVSLAGLAVFPFLIPDLLKAALAAALDWVRPRQD